MKQKLFTKFILIGAIGFFVSAINAMDFLAHCKTIGTFSWQNRTVFAGFFGGYLMRSGAQDLYRNWCLGRGYIEWQKPETQKPCTKCEALTKAGLNLIGNSFDNSYSSSSNPFNDDEWGGSSSSSSTGSSFSNLFDSDDSDQKIPTESSTTPIPKNSVLGKFFQELKRPYVKGFIKFSLGVCSCLYALTARIK